MQSIPRDTEKWSEVGVNRSFRVFCLRLMHFMFVREKYEVKSQRQKQQREMNARAMFIMSMGLKHYL